MKLEVKARVGEVARMVLITGMKRNPKRTVEKRAKNHGEYKSNETNRDKGASAGDEKLAGKK